MKQNTMQKFLDIVGLTTVILLLIGSFTLPLIVKYSFPAYFFEAGAILFIFYCFASILTINNTK